MNNAAFYTLFCTLSLLFFLPSLWARLCWSGGSYTERKSTITMIYNGTFIFVHLNFIRNRELPFVGEVNPDTIGWVSFGMLFLYMYALPTERNIKTRLFRKQQNIK